jgi:nicotinamidase-related amidase
MNSRNRLLASLLLSAPLAFGAAAGGPLDLHLKRGDSVQAASWAPAETAIIICDMWDDHTCKGAARRVATMAPKLDAFVSAARARGVFIVHAPSGTMKFYKDTAQRKRAQDAPLAAPPVPIESRVIMPERESALPIDATGYDWCDCKPKCDIKAAVANGVPWTRQIKTITISSEDAISASGQEIYNLFEQRGIRNVILCGVHTNQCVLGRPFGIRQMVLLGKNVALVRDLTDCLYDSENWPYVTQSHATTLVVDHIEKYWCPSLASADVLQ